ncbi:hypothetical protein [Campylobacter majalis]|uniref:hypothetical protein n=1 Tax=Campylobacter majalis TaxID=2790656 RepID=UPI001E284486|nr:hypothetical protein [Campylobacter majalis]
MSEDNCYEFLANEEYFLKLRLVIGVLMAKMKKNFGKVCLMLLKKARKILPNTAVWLICVILEA